jgi:hypothetical protein
MITDVGPLVLVIKSSKLMVALLPCIGPYTARGAGAMYQPHETYRYTFGIVRLLSERGSSVLSLMTFAELARRCRNDSLGATNDTWAHR